MRHEAHFLTTAIEKTLREDSNPMIQESEFIRYLLPLFDPRVPDRMKNMQGWIAISGSPYTPVDVYRNNEKLFTVPPLIDRDNTEIEGDGKVIARVLESAIDDFHHNALADSQNAINAVSDKIVVNSGNKWRADWEKIFEKYKIPYTKMAVEQKENSTKPSENMAVQSYTPFTLDD